MKLDQMEAEVLGWLLDDFEAPRSLASDISREIGRPVSEAEVAEILARLVARGLAQAFTPSQQSGSFVPFEAAELPAAAGQLWFMATSEGRALISDAA